MTRRLTVLTLLILGGAALIVVRPDAAQRPKPPGAEFKGEAFRFNRIHDGIYHAVGTGSISVGCSASIIVGGAGGRRRRSDRLPPAPREP